LRKNGCRILERNFCVNDAEIDIIAERRGTVHFVEVKTRIADVFGSPEESVTQSKQQKIHHAAEQYLARFRHAPSSVSFDIIGLVLDDHQQVKELNWNIAAF